MRKCKAMMRLIIEFSWVYSVGLVGSTGGSFKSERVSLAATASAAPRAVNICHVVGFPPTRTTTIEPVKAITNAVTALTMIVIVLINQYQVQPFPVSFDAVLSPAASAQS